MAASLTAVLGVFFTVAGARLATPCAKTCQRKVLAAAVAHFSREISSNKAAGSRRVCIVWETATAFDLTPEQARGADADTPRHLSPRSARASGRAADARMKRSEPARRAGDTVSPEPLADERSFLVQCPLEKNPIW